MKCPECGGYKNFVSLDGTPFEVVRPCKRCHGTGEIEVTNEEWFDSLTTEEKAKVLACEFIVACDDYAYSNNKETWNEKYWVEWLKQPHNFKKR